MDANGVCKNLKLDLLAGLPRLERIRTVEVMASVHEAALKDGHGLLVPTHLVRRGGEIAGAFSVGAVPLVTMWLDSKVLKGRESFGLINVVENLIRANAPGPTVGAVLVERSSPFYPVMGPMGYREMGDMVLFTKEV